MASSFLARTILDDAVTATAVSCLEKHFLDDDADEDVDAPMRMTTDGNVDAFPLWDQLIQAFGAPEWNEPFWDFGDCHGRGMVRYRSEHLVGITEDFARGSKQWTDLFGPPPTALIHQMIPEAKQLRKDRAKQQLRTRIRDLRASRSKGK